MTSEDSAVFMFIWQLCVCLFLTAVSVYESDVFVISLWCVAADVRFDVICNSEEDYLYKLCHQSEASSADLWKTVIKLA